MFKRKNKFGNVKVETDGRRFDSMLERAVYGILKLRESAGEITNIRCQETVYLGKARYIYRPDFSFTDVATGKKIYCEAKGNQGGRWPGTKKQWMGYAEHDLEIWIGSHSNPKLERVLKPSNTNEDWQGCKICLSHVRTYHPTHEAASGAV